MKLNGPTSLAAASLLLATALVAAAFFGWMAQSDTLFISMLVAGLPGCFGL
ncbi:hypothetical protein [Afifella pfennigii]|uniref:hypothetical protein n=1 Tax=Afifella pfennigii TaxID=209897 RepID=UPI0012EB5F03|nr:hypothetical protein [Afifella pfennigii]